MGDLRLLSPLSTVWLRSITADDTLVSAAGVNPVEAVDLDTLSVLTGQWVTLNAAGKAVLAGDTDQVVSVVYVGNRNDTAEAKTVNTIDGHAIIETTVFDNAGTYALGTEVMVVAGQLKDATVGKAVVGICEGAKFGANTTYPNGYLRVRTLAVPYIKA
jgi:hypothetical protein